MAELRFESTSSDCKSILDAFHTSVFSWGIGVNISAREPDKGLPRCFASWLGYPHGAAVSERDEENSMKIQPINLTVA